jgi:hypothetical protein
MARTTEEVIAARVPTDVATALRELARENDRSVSGELRILLRRWLETQAPARADGGNR